MDLEVREARAADGRAVAELVVAAFGDAEGREIADLVAALLEDPGAEPRLSLVATESGRVVGHVLFTGVRVPDAAREVSAAILAPLSVSPAFQDRGIGGRLVREGLVRLRAAGVELVFVLGHPGYYPRYGFSPAGEKGLDAPHPIPPEKAAAWMVAELRPGTLDEIRGRVACADALADPRHWRE